jgi:hypothetical protein
VISTSSPKAKLAQEGGRYQVHFTLAVAGLDE